MDNAQSIEAAIESACNPQEIAEPLPLVDDETLMVAMACSRIDEGLRDIEDAWATSTI